MIKKDIEDSVQAMRNIGYRGELTIVPVIHKRCFAPCPLYACNCTGTIDHGRFTIVGKDYMKRCMNEANGEIEFMNKMIEEVYNEKN